MAAVAVAVAAVVAVAAAVNDDGRFYQYMFHNRIIRKLNR